MSSVMLKLLTPQKIFYRGEVEMVIVEETLGKEGYMAGHSPAFKKLREGEIKIWEKESRKKRIALISGGYIYVNRDIVIYTKSVFWKE